MENAYKKNRNMYALADSTCWSECVESDLMRRKKMKHVE